MFGLDEQIAALNTGDVFLVVIGIAVLLGLRHATDPDHLTAVSTLLASEAEDRRTTRRAATLGAAWGLGHATTLFIFGLPIVLFDDYLPEWFTQAAEVLIGLVIMALAVRLLLRWRRGYLHAHEHVHDAVRHRHVHAHPRAATRGPRHAGAPHSHRHPAPPRSPLASYGIGLVHGIGGSAGVGILLLAAIPSQAQGVLALLLFALFTAVSMSLASSGFGYTLSRPPVRRAFANVAPALGALSLAFGAWYALGAANAVPYVF